MRQVPQVDAARAKTMLDDGVAEFIDIRDVASYSAAHIPGARHLTNETVQGFLDAADKDRPLVVYCYHGNSSQGATLWLLERGFKEVVSLAGGFEGWRSAFGAEAIESSRG